MHIFPATAAGHPGLHMQSSDSVVEAEDHAENSDDVSSGAEATQIQSAHYGKCSE